MFNKSLKLCSEQRKIIVSSASNIRKVQRASPSSLLSNERKNFQPKMFLKCFWRSLPVFFITDPFHWKSSPKRFKEFFSRVAFVRFPVLSNRYKRIFYPQEHEEKRAICIPTWRYQQITKEFSEIDACLIKTTRLTGGICSRSQASLSP